MDSFQDNSWDFFDYTIIEDGASTDFYWTNQSSCMEIDASPLGAAPLVKRCKRRRGENESCSQAGSKACREKVRREKINDRFLELSSVLEPGQPAKTDKVAVLIDAMRALHHLRTEAQELKEKNKKLQEDIKNLKTEKNELREEKHVLKADKEKMEQKVKAMTAVHTGFVPPQPAIYSAGGKNMMMTLPNYGGYPMWQWIPQAVLDTSQDHVLRPPVA